MNKLKEWMYFISSCLNQLDQYEYIKTVDVFYMPKLKATRSL